MDHLAWAVIASLILLIASGMLTVFEQLRFFRWLRDKHVRAWIELAAPDAASLLSQTRGHSQAYDFLMSRRYTQLNDLDLNELGDGARRMWLAVYWQAGVFVLLVLALAVTQ
jgi:hypothetical protein